MIKFTSRPNLIYPIQLLIWSFLRNLETELISMFFPLNNGFIYCPLMFLGEFTFGLIIYLYQQKYLKKKNTDKNKIKFMDIELIENVDLKMNIPDKNLKIIFLILFIPFFDFIEFTLSIELLSKFFTTSYSLESRLRGILIILDASIYYFLLKLQIFKHQFFSLIIITICLIITIITEFIFQDINIYLSYGNFTLFIIIIFLIHFFNSFLDLIEKYLFEFDFMNPFMTLMAEGIFGLIFSIFYCIYDNVFNDIKLFFKNNSASNIILMVFLLIIYVILSGGKNTFRILTNKIYSPMTATLAEYFLNPFYIIYYFIFHNDFISNGNKNYAYFIINIILSLLITLSGCVYNEFLVLFFCGLERETHSQVSKRASVNKEIYSLYEDEDSDFNSIL